MPHHVDNKAANKNVIKDDYRLATSALMRRMDVKTSLLVHIADDLLGPESLGRADAWRYIVELLFKVPETGSKALQDLVKAQRSIVENLELQHIATGNTWRATLAKEAEGKGFHVWFNSVVTPARSFREVRFEFEFSCVVLKLYEKLSELIEDSHIHSGSKDEALAI